MDIKQELEGLIERYEGYAKRERNDAAKYWKLNAHLVSNHSLGCSETYERVSRALRELVDELEEEG